MAALIQEALASKQQFQDAVLYLMMDLYRIGPTDNIPAELEPLVAFVFLLRMRLFDPELMSLRQKKGED